MNDKPFTDFDTRLTEFRAQIDAIDDKLIELLIERIGIVSQVGEMKNKDFPGTCPLRAGREAEMVRRIIKKFEGTKFSPAAAAAMWRILIGASTNTEGQLKLAVYASDTNADLYWLAREYFGSFLPVTKQPMPKRVIGDVMDGKASIGIIPLLTSSDTTNWWTDLLQSGKDAPKIFAHVPFVYHGRPAANAPAGLAIARIEPEPSGDDLSLLVLEADHNVSQNRLQTAFTAAKLEARWINIVTLNPVNRHHLIEIKGFVKPDQGELKKVLDGLGESIKQATFLGAYATPVILSASAPSPRKEAV